MWIVPDVTIEGAAGDDQARAWAAALPARATEIAGDWGLTPDGPAWAGFEAVVWPVRRDGHPLAFKVGRPEQLVRECAALAALGATGLVPEIHESDPGRAAVLMERLDADRPLEGHPDIDEAVSVIGEAMARIHTVAPPDVPRTGPHARRMHDGIARHLAEFPGTIPERAAERAREILTSTFDDSADHVLLHGDLHFLNVFARLGTTDDWVVIDPWPFVGEPGWDAVALLRNRWAEAVATGDPDRALRRRVDQLADRTAMTSARTRELAGAVAVDNLAWMLPRDPGHMFVEPYRVLAGWLAE